MLTGKIGKWDQFAANKQKFDVEASFDENVYTSRLNKEELCMKKIQHAEQLAKEIEGSSMLSGNIHMEEERGKVVEGDYDEEDLYSGVLGKTEQAQKKNEDGLTENKDATKAPNETLSPATVVTQAKDVAINKDNSESTPPAALATPE